MPVAQQRGAAERLGDLDRLPGEADALGEREPVAERRHRPAEADVALQDGEPAARLLVRGHLQALVDEPLHQRRRRLDAEPAPLDGGHAAGLEADPRPQRLRPRQRAEPVQRRVVRLEGLVAVVVGLVVVADRPQCPAVLEVAVGQGERLLVHLQGLGDGEAAPRRLAGRQQHLEGARRVRANAAASSAQARSASGPATAER